ncbi:XAC2610-related protein [Emticicia sp. C21]|uniref:XAC2610-related protein n=1 Tax=Emticicia sp. C21 TaxID=2302915 RepID=UPI0011C0DD69|nr:hypothetical protein [Emticicia sp. C21]
MTKISAQQQAVIQQCSYTDLSKEFDVKIFLRRFERKDDIYDSCTINLTISDKLTHQKMDTLYINPSFYAPDVFKKCNHVLSYSTKVSFEGVGDDNDYGDIIIADLNFDNKDDIAVINNSGGNGGVFYNYYIQENKKFVLNRYLTDSMNYFPTKINKSKRTLTTYVHASAVSLGEHIYYLTADKGWIEKSHKFVPYPKEP